MRQIATDHRKLKTWQRNISLFLAVAWLSVLIQPCVMAATANAVEVGSPTTGHGNTVAHDQAVCAHCSNLVSGCDSDKSSSSLHCLGGDSDIGIITVAAVEQKAQVDKVDLLTFGFASLADARTPSRSNILATPSGSYYSNPSIIDLFCTYLI